MGNKISKIIEAQLADGDMGTLDALRTLSGFDVRRVEMQTSAVRSRIVEVYRDPSGRITHSVERFEETEYTDGYAGWTR